MLKISHAESPQGAVTLTLAGRLVGPWVGELRRVCEPLLAGRRAMALDLAEVSFLDAEGVATLHAYLARGVTLQNCSPFVDQQIRTSN